MQSHLQAGVVIYNQGHYKAAHDAWEDHWLSLDAGCDDEVLLHGLIQCTASVYHATTRNWSGAGGLAESARTYLSSLPGGYRGVNVGPIVTYLEALARDPEYIDRRRPVRLRYEGVALDGGNLEFEAIAITAPILAAADGYEPTLLETAVGYAWEAVVANESNQFVGLVYDFVSSPDRRRIIVSRLSQHVQRRKSRETDVSGLFDG